MEHAGTPSLTWLAKLRIARRRFSASLSGRVPVPEGGDGGIIPVGGLRVRVNPSLSGRAPVAEGGEGGIIPVGGLRVNPNPNPTTHEREGGIQVGGLATQGRGWFGFRGIAPVAERWEGGIPEQGLATQGQEGMIQVGGLATQGRGWVGFSGIASALGRREGGGYGGLRVNPNPTPSPNPTTRGEEGGIPVGGLATQGGGRVALRCGHQYHHECIAA